MEPLFEYIPVVAGLLIALIFSAIKRFSNSSVYLLLCCVLAAAAIHVASGEPFAFIIDDLLSTTLSALIMTWLIKPFAKATYL